MPSHYGMKNGRKVRAQKGRGQGKKMHSAPHHAETKGSVSKTHKGDLDYTTKKTDKDFHRNHHDILRSRRPFHQAVANALHSAHSGGRNHA